MDKEIGELPFTNRQQWHHVILNALSDGKWQRPQQIEGVKFDRIYELEAYGMVERGIERNTGAAPASIYKITDEGQKYFVMLNSGELFRIDLAEFDAIYLRLCFYLISGDMREAYTHCVQFLQSPGDVISKNIICGLMLRSNNGYLHTVAMMYLQQGADGVRDLDPDHSIRPSWVDNAGKPVKYKALNMKISQVGEDALSKVTTRMKSLGLRSYLKGQTGSEGFSAEIALIIVASRLDELLPDTALEVVTG